MAFHVETQGAQCGHCAPSRAAKVPNAISPQASDQDSVIASDA